MKTIVLMLLFLGLPLVGRAEDTAVVAATLKTPQEACRYVAGLIRNATAAEQRYRQPGTGYANDLAAWDGALNRAMSALAVVAARFPNESYMKCPEMQAASKALLK